MKNIFISSLLTLAASSSFAQNITIPEDNTQEYLSCKLTGVNQENVEVEADIQIEKSLSELYVAIVKFSNIGMYLDNSQVNETNYVIKGHISGNYGSISFNLNKLSENPVAFGGMAQIWYQKTQGSNIHYTYIKGAMTCMEPTGNTVIINPLPPVVVPF